MVSIDAFRNRIRQQVSEGRLLEEDFSFLMPGGNDHLMQFLFKSFAGPYDDFDKCDLHRLELMEILAETGIDFQLDDDGAFATLTVPDGKTRKTIQAVMDLRDEQLIMVYYFGESRSCWLLSQKLLRSKGLHSCYLNPETLRRMTPEFEKVNSVQFAFEQLPTLFLEPTVLKGLVKGERAEEIGARLADRHDFYFAVDRIGGYLSDGARGTVTISAEGLLQGDSCRLDGFIGIAAKLQAELSVKYTELITRHIIVTDRDPSAAMIMVTGSPLELAFPFALDRTDGLSTFLTRGNRWAPFFGTCERRSRRLWGARSTELRTGHQLTVEFSDRFVRVFLPDINAIPVWDQLERFIRQHISAVSGDGST
jgi:hypothetical protein